MGLLAAVALCAAGCASSDDEALEDASGELGADETSAAAAANVLYLDQPPPAACRAESGDEKIRCLISARYASDPAARDLAVDYFQRTGGVPGVAPAERYDGGYRGIIQLVPELPVGQYRKHLEWTTGAMREIDSFFTELGRHASAPIVYRYKKVDFRFMRSVGRTTPSAQAGDKFEIFYNVVGGLNKSQDVVRETLVHELFHVNDNNRNEWSSRALAPIVNAIVRKCGTRSSCLAPYTPTDTMVNGGTYYAFQPTHYPTEIEYSAELASRYFEEQRAMVARQPLRKPAFKCGPAENKQAWDLIVGEFFGGVDLVPPC